jgi:hypothetical protein
VDLPHVIAFADDDALWHNEILFSMTQASSRLYSLTMETFLTVRHAR